MTRIHIFKTNRRIKPSPFVTACKNKDGLLGYVEVGHYTMVEDMASDFRVDPGTNVWVGIADELNKPGVFDKLARFFKK